MYNGDSQKPSSRFFQGAHSALIYTKYPEGIKKKKFEFTFNVDSDPS